jgi:hypothetical protein
MSFIARKALWEKGVPAKYTIPKVLTEFSFGIG